MLSARRSRFDRLLALRISERWSEVIVAWREFEDEGIAPPPYVVEAAADAYLAQRQPGQAETLYRSRLAVEPGRHNTRISLFYALIKQEDYAGGLAVIDALVEDSMAGDDRWHYSLDGEYGDSDGVSEFGSRDRGFGIRLTAPWLGNHLQPFFVWNYNDATLPEGEADYDRFGTGLAWRHRQQHAYLEAHRSRTGSSESGLTAGYNRQLDDHWSVAVRYESFTTDVPLRGRGQGLDGWKAETSARWQAHESLGVRMNLSRLDLSDGNVRYAALVGVPHRLHASAHHVTEASLDLYGSRSA